MAQRTIVLRTDDIDGSEATETIEFTLDGTAYTIDVSDRNAARLRASLAEFIASARTTGRSSPPRAAATAPRRRAAADAKAVRAWAAEHGYELSQRGRIPTTVLDAYHQAG